VDTVSLCFGQIAFTRDVLNEDNTTYTSKDFHRALYHRGNVLPQKKVCVVMATRFVCNAYRGVNVQILHIIVPRVA
jgi:hypothetical protein